MSRCKARRCSPSARCWCTPPPLGGVLFVGEAARGHETRAPHVPRTARKSPRHALGRATGSGWCRKSKGVETRRSAGRSVCPRARAAGVRGLPRHDGADGGPGAHVRDRHRRRPAPDLPGPGARLRPAFPPRDHARAGAGGHRRARPPLDGPDGAAWGVCTACVALGARALCACRVAAGMGCPCQSGCGCIAVWAAVPVCAVQEAVQGGAPAPPMQPGHSPAVQCRR